MAELREVFEMVTKQTEPDVDSWRDQERRQRRKTRGRKLGAIAVAAVFIAAAILAIRFSGEEPRRQPADRSTTGSVPDNGPLMAGTHSIESFEPIVTFTVDPGWSVGWDLGDGIPMTGGAFSMERPLSDAGFVRLSLWDTTDLEFYDLDTGQLGPAPRDFVGLVRSRDEVSGLSERQSAFAGGGATRLDFTWEGSQLFIKIPGVDPATAAFQFDITEFQHWFVLDTGDGQLLVDWTVEDTLAVDVVEAEAEQLVNDVLRTLNVA
jgi:hypothetical protein